MWERAHVIGAGESESGLERRDEWKATLELDRPMRRRVAHVANRSGCVVERGKHTGLPNLPEASIDGDRGDGICSCDSTMSRVETGVAA